MSKRLEPEGGNEMHIRYEMSPLVCSAEVQADVEKGIVHNVRFTGGCPGNLLAISKLVEGMKAEDVVRLLEGNPCGGKETSCADQLAKALKQALARGE